MISCVARSSGLAPSLSAVFQGVPSGLRPAVGVCAVKSQNVILQPPQETHTNFSVANLIQTNVLSNYGPRASMSLAGSSQRRLAHTDVQVPDFTYYRKDSVKDGNVKSNMSADTRKAFSYVIVAGGAALATYSAKNMVRGALSVLGASADVLAAGQLEVKLADIPEGKNAVFKWRDKPLFIRHRTAEEIEKEQAVDPGILRDKEHDNDRVKNPEWLVVLGICTHLGCVPISGVGDYGGYYCPCHGSHYDASGRIRKGPAPLNLEVPIYDFPDDETLLVG